MNADLVVAPASEATATGPGAAVATPVVAVPTARARRGLTVGIAVFALLVRLPGLGRPRSLVFDELFYAPDAADLLRWGSEHGQPAHPALGKWLIAGGIAVFGFDPVGWRISSVLAGAAVCALVAWTAVRATGRLAAGAVAGVVVVADGLVHVTSRLALLDVFVALFTTATVAALVAAWTAQPDRRAASRWWAAAVAALALGTAVKWSALSLAPVVVVVGWVLAGRLLAPGRPRRRGRAAVLAAVVLLPPLVVVAASLPRQLGPDRTTAAGYLEEQQAVLRFHRELRPTNRNAAPAWTWAAQTHPANLYRARCPIGAPLAFPGVEGARTAATTVDGSCPDGRWVARIIAGANPVVWLVGLVGVGWALVAALRGRELAALLVGAVASVWVPWLASPRDSYSFYAVALTPLLVLAAALASSQLAGRVRRFVEPAAAVLALGAFAAWWPVWSGHPTSPDLHRWLTSWPGWS